MGGVAELIYEVNQTKTRFLLPNKMRHADFQR